MPVYAIQGTLGSGKTLLMGLFSYYFHIGAEADVYCNYGLNFGSRITTYEEMFGLKNGVLAIDEAHVLIDSRFFSNKKVIKFTQWALQSRKAGLIVFLTTQSIHQIDKRVRGIVDRLYVCQQYRRGTTKGTRYTICTPIDYDTQFLPRGSKTIIHQQWMYDLYDTLEIVNDLK